MNLSLRSSTRLRSLSSGAITTNLLRSKPIWRSISGKVPRPMEPKPIIMIGPSKRAWTGQAVVLLVMAFMFEVSKLRIILKLRDGQMPRRDQILGQDLDQALDQDLG